MVGVQKRWIIEIEKGADPRLSLGLQLARVLDIPLDSVTP
jgi:DNA-binding XRE family transcriptional regulator